ncbi:hypothetical protein L596_020416 [Steinernema carpocapsae]|uniref:F-box associated domain-containing protein n=1 Tax=Steinernema carpocapsae TaxID=34508 RepID=A0A4U5MTK1_STECR|nr:hypothetical protein L596_020416 [Steinernema carpocapsae]
MGTTSSRNSSPISSKPLSATLLLSQYDESRAFFQLLDSEDSTQIALNNYGQVDDYFVSQISPADLSEGPGQGHWENSQKDFQGFFKRLIEIADLPIRNLYFQNIDLSLLNEGKYEEARCMLKAVGTTVKNLYVDGVYGCEQEVRDILVNAILSEQIHGLQMTNVDLTEDVPEIVLKWVEKGLWRHVEILQVNGCQLTTTFMEAVLEWWNRTGCQVNVTRKMVLDLKLTAQDAAQFSGKQKWIRKGRAPNSKAVIRRHGWDRFELDLS